AVAVVKLDPVRKPISVGRERQARVFGEHFINHHSSVASGGEALDWRRVGGVPSAQGDPENVASSDEVRFAIAVQVAGGDVSRGWNLHHQDRSVRGVGTGASEDGYRFCGGVGDRKIDDAITIEV